MRAALFSVLIAVIALAHAAPHSQKSTVVNLRTQASPETCGDSADLVPLFLTYDTTQTVHLYTILDSQVTNAILQGVYTFNGVTAFIFPTLEPSTVPLFTFANTRTSAFFYTTSANESSTALAAGYIDNGVTGYIYPTQVCGSVPLYRAHFIGVNEDYIYTTSVAERDNAIVGQGFVDEGIAGYVMEVASGIIID
ncbi:hypothetical protein B0H16DRAFT_1368920 [Mycena metata]|uniref:DUF5648 domain-containing protein n=1 Tax=Mycena metata TaxID=1033252 RepID=A0AAD7JG45_9AGAR|nr:hypothetical protein B0H16DRAFT_1368920 [Mycena metata]